MKTPKNTAFLLQSGEAHMRSDVPTMFVIDGAQPYLWVGNDSHESKGCFATICGRAKLRRLAKAILKATA